ncbi:hypothetical protein PFISCL1PPCAC_15989, partial [Pristionchus fissidentatus]
RYSRMWRHFDAGLYSFLKNQVYLPLLTHPKLSTGLGRPLALVSAFLVVVAWHGTQRNYVFWVCLSALELIIERVGVSIWDGQGFQGFRARNGDVAVRRSAAWGMILTVAPGILGVFYFLSGAQFGDSLVLKIIINGLVGVFTLDFSVTNGTPSPGLFLLYLLALGYFFNQTCLELEFKHRKAPKTIDNDNNNSIKKVE